MLSTFTGNQQHLSRRHLPALQAAGGQDGVLGGAAGFGHCPQILPGVDRPEGEGGLAAFGLPGFPHSIAVDMGTRMKFTGFIYTPRMDKDKGLISQYTFSVSDDGRNWREVKKGQFSYHYIRKDPAVQRIDFGRPVEARYFKLDARSPVRGGEQSATVAELNIITQ